MPGQTEGSYVYCQLGLEWRVQRHAVRASGQYGHGGEEEPGAEGASSLRKCASGLCDDAEHLSFRAVPRQRCGVSRPEMDVAEGPRRSEEEEPGEEQVLRATGVGMVGRFEQPGPVAISFLVNASRVACSSCSDKDQGYLILRRDLDFSVPNQCAQVYVAGQYCGVDPVAHLCALCRICLS